HVHRGAVTGHGSTASGTSPFSPERMYVRQVKWTACDVEVVQPYRANVCLDTPASEQPRLQHARNSVMLLRRWRESARERESNQQTLRRRAKHRVENRRQPLEQPRGLPTMDLPANVGGEQLALNLHLGALSSREEVEAPASIQVMRFNIKPCPHEVHDRRDLVLHGQETTVGLEAIEEASAKPLLAILGQTFEQQNHPGSKRRQLVASGSSQSLARAGAHLS
ncbi:hypothetical protein, partial [Piscinibacter defluvii]|uniref:hypothetical protein n=1 Tax=Piscinibacter defluvii TaxID=1796922 RepID=UPI00197B4574